MISTGGILGVLGALAILAAFQVHKSPRFQTESFRAKPLQEQRRTVRTWRILLGAGAAVMFGGAFALGFVQGYVAAQASRAAVKTLFEDVTRQSAALQNEFNSVEESLRPDELLAPERLVTAGGLADARGRLARYAEAMNRLEAGTLALARDVEAGLERPDITRADRETMLASFRRSRDEHLRMMGEFMRAKRDIMAAVGEMLDLVEARRGRLKVKDGALVFANAADAKRSDAIAARIEEAAAREEKIAQQLTERSQRTGQRAQKALGK